MNKIWHIKQLIFSVKKKTLSKMQNNLFMRKFMNTSVIFNKKLFNTKVLLMRVFCKLFYHKYNATFIYHVNLFCLSLVFCCFVIISDLWKKKIFVTSKVQLWKLENYWKTLVEISVLHLENFRKICYFDGKLCYFSIISIPFSVYAAHYGKT